MLYPPNPTQFSVWVAHMYGAWGGVEGQISLNVNYKVNFKDFISNFVYVLINERFKTYQMRFLFQGRDFGALGCLRRQHIFFEHGHVIYHIDGHGDQDRMQVNYHPRVKLMTLVVRSNINKFSLLSLSLSLSLSLYGSCPAMTEMLLIGILCLNLNNLSSYQANKINR